MNLSNGTEFSHYRIVRKIGSGGTGMVYLALDLSLQRQVAIKFLKSLPGQRPDEEERLLAEARTTAQQQHPACVTLYEVGRFRDTPYLVLEYVEGTPLDQLLGTERMNPERVIEIASQLCVGLQSAHRRGVVHGDIKPANLIVDREGRLRILDFGVARLLDSPPVWTDSSLSGTLRYMAPEVLVGKPPDPRSDLFSVGVLLYHMLSGKLPFSGPFDAAVIYSITNDNPVPLKEHVPDLSPELAGIVDRLLEKDPAKRFDDAGDLLEALQAANGDARRPTSASDAIPRQRGLKVAGILAVLCGATLLSWYLIWGRGPAERQRMMLAVLPFDNLGAQGDEYFADGVTDAVTLQLARSRGLGVISRYSAMSYKSTGRSLPDIADELGVDYLVTGSIHWKREATDSVRINVSLVRPADDSYIWTETFDGAMDEIFALQDEIAQHVSEALHVNGRAAPQPAVNLAAYDLYLRGNDYFYRSWDRSDIEFAGSLYAQAIDLDTTFAAAYAMQSRVDASLFWERHDLSPSRCESAFTAARRALALDGGLDLAYLALGYCYYHCNRDYEAAISEFEKGLQLHPNQGELHNAVAAVKRRQEKLDEALAGFKEALRLDPRSHLKAFDVGLTLGMQRRYDEASSYVERTTMLAPDYALAHIYRAWLPVLSRGDTAEARRIIDRALATTDLTRSPYYWWLLRILEPNAYHRPGSLPAGADMVSYFLFRARSARSAGEAELERAFSDSARSILRPRVASRPQDAYETSSLGVAFAGLRQPDSALAYGQHAVEMFATSGDAFDAPFLLLNLAEILTVFGESDEAVNQLEFVMSIPGFASVFYLRLDPLWAPLREHPRFKQLITPAQSSS